MNQKIKFLKTYKKIIKNISNLENERNTIISRHLNIDFNRDKETRIKEIIGNSNINRSCVYLASSMGFNKMTWNKDIENLLKEFGLKQKLEMGIYKNYKRYEVLKLLIQKLINKRKGY